MTVIFFYQFGRVVYEWLSVLAWFGAVAVSLGLARLTWFFVRQVAFDAVTVYAAWRQAKTDADLAKTRSTLLVAEAQDFLEQNKLKLLTTGVEHERNQN